MQNISRTMHQNCFPNIKLPKNFGKNLEKNIIVSRDGRAAHARLHQPEVTAADLDNVVHVCDSRIAIVKMITTMKYTSSYLNTIGKLNTPFSVLERRMCDTVSKV